MITSLTIWSFHSVCWIHGYFRCGNYSNLKFRLSLHSWWTCRQGPCLGILNLVHVLNVLDIAFCLSSSTLSFCEKWFRSWEEIQVLCGFLPLFVSCLLQAALNFHLAHVARKRWTTALHPKGNSNKENQRATNPGKWREWSKIIEGNDQRPWSCNAICFCHFLPGSGTSKGISGWKRNQWRYFRRPPISSPQIWTEKDCTVSIHHYPSSIINLKHPQASSSSSIRPNALKLSLAELWSHFPWQRLLRARSLKVSLSFQPTCRLQNWIRGCSAAGQTIVKIRTKRNALYQKLEPEAPSCSFKGIQRD